MLQNHTLQFELGSLTLNSQQYEIVETPLNQHLRVLASAGSGKTTTITAKIAHALTHLNLRPEQVVLTTFSRSGADTMRERLEKLVGSTTAYIGTFHALSLQILRQHDPATIEGIMHTVDELPYLWLDFLKTDKGKAWSSKIKMLVVDEFQDINDIQLDIIRAILAESQSFVIIVGDDAQNIYAWRGSRVDYILNMHEEIKAIQDFQLTYNYRSSTSIVAVANSLMRKIPTLSHKERMTAVKMGSQTPEFKPEVRYFHRFAGEVGWIVNDIQTRLAQADSAGTSAPTIAILSKYNNVLFQFEEAFVQRKITCRLMTEEKINKRKKQADVILSTFHAAKGLEWDVVYIVKLHDGAFPQMKHEEGIDEERRLFYVAVTRARSQLIMTYSKGEKNMCRFLREIHRPLLRWYSIAQHTSIDEEVAVERKDIESFFMSWTGEDFRKIKLNPGTLPPLLLKKTDGIQYKNFFPAGEQYTIPDWVFRIDSMTDFSIFIRYYILREIGLRFPESAGEWDDKVRLSLFRIRILKEDLPIYEKEQELIQQCVTALFPARLGIGAEAPPVFEFTVLQQKITELTPGREWTMEEMIPVMQILHKIRSVIYNLRHVESKLEEFLLGPAKGSPPMIMRNDLITSWRRVTDRSLLSSATVYDLYRLACIYSSRLGRNAPLYKIPDPTDLKECLPFLEKISDHILTDINLLATEAIQARVTLRDPRLELTCEADLIAGHSIYMFLEGDSRAEIQRLDRWIEGLARVSIARKNGYEIKNLCYIQPLTGVSATLPVDGWDDTEFRAYLATKVLIESS
jgi:hypothetical protein